MNVYWHNRFEGMWPVPTAAVVVAETPADAAAILRAELKPYGLGADIKPEDFNILDTGIERAVVLSNGDY